MKQCPILELLEEVSPRILAIKDFIYHADENYGEIPNRTKLMDAKQDIDSITKSIDLITSKQNCKECGQ